MAISLCKYATTNLYLNLPLQWSTGGDRFTDYEEQKELEHILVRTEQLRGWPTAAAQDQLRHAWEWT